MKMPFIGNSREKERQKLAREDSDRQASERRAAQRRKDIRLIYPVGDAPQLVAYPSEPLPDILKNEPRILTENFRIVDICRCAIRFVYEVPCSQCDRPLVENERIGFSIKFHDDEKVDLTGTIMRHAISTETKNGTFVCMLTTGLDAERIIKEQSYLLRKYPDFCRATQKDKRFKEVPANGATT